MSQDTVFVLKLSGAEDTYVANANPVAWSDGAWLAKLFDTVEAAETARQQVNDAIAGQTVIHKIYRPS